MHLMKKRKLVSIKITDVVGELFLGLELQIGESLKNYSWFAIQFLFENVESYGL